MYHESSQRVLTYSSIGADPKDLSADPDCRRQSIDLKSPKLRKMMKQIRGKARASSQTPPFVGRRAL